MFLLGANIFKTTEKLISIEFSYSIQSNCFLDLKTEMITEIHNKHTRAVHSVKLKNYNKCINVQ